MFVDEIIAEFLEYRRNKLLRVKIENRVYKKINKINRLVFVRDLIVRYKDYHHSFGESATHTNQHTQPSAQRLHDHIGFLFSLANVEHRRSYCIKKDEGHYELNPDKKNHITRLSTNEFSFYTMLPLTTIEFLNLLDHIARLAEHLEPNVHVLLSSFAVQDSERILMNMCLFIEGGKLPKIHSFAKNTASRIDVNYSRPDHVLSQQKIGYRGTFKSNYLATKDSVAISYGSVFEVETVGGARYTQAVDICYDHSLSHSKELMLRRMDDAEPDEILPLQVEQCVTSNSIMTKEYAVISTHVLHADSIDRATGTRDDAPTLTTSERQQVIPIGYRGMQIVDAPQSELDAYTVVNPPFGSDFTVDILQERQVGIYIPAIHVKVDLHNKKARERFILAALNMDSTNQYAKKPSQEREEILAKLDKSDCLISTFPQLESKLLEQCQPTFWQFVFGTQEYHQKVGAKEIIIKSFAFIQNAISKTDSGTLSLLILVRPWKKDLCFKLRALDITSSSPLITSIIRNINNDIHNNIETALGVEFDPPSQSDPAIF